jgi:hypothetical protein
MVAYGNIMLLESNLKGKLYDLVSNLESMGALCSRNPGF